MKIALITLQEDLDAHGLRCISGALRAAGHETMMIFLGKESMSRGAVSLWARDRKSFDATTLENVAELCRGADWIGFSVMTLYFHETAEVSDFLRTKLGRPIVWGGIHPTIRPEECLRHADVAVLGEAEDTVVELADRLQRGASLEGLAGVRIRGVDAKANPVRQPVRNLDSVPLPDISIEGHAILYKGRLRPLTPEILRRKTGGHYMTINARGCTLRCTYCCNSQYGALFEWDRVRAKSPGRIIEELKRARESLPGLTGVKLSDDDFGDLPIDYIREFAARYRAEIGLPLGIPGFRANNLTEEKLRLLVEAGLVYLRIGIQSGSPRIRKLYGRRESNEEIVEATRLINRHRDRIERFKIDMITDNPWETDEDRIASVELLKKIPKPYVMTLFSLTFLPGTPLHTKATREGLIRDERRAVYGKHFYGYDRAKPLNRVLALFSRPDVLPDRIDGLVEARRSPLRFRWRYWNYLRDLDETRSGAAGGTRW